MAMELNDRVLVALMQLRLPMVYEIKTAALLSSRGRLDEVVRLVNRLQACGTVQLVIEHMKDKEDREERRASKLIDGLLEQVNAFVLEGETFSQSNWRALKVDLGDQIECYYVEIRRWPGRVAEPVEKSPSQEGTVKIGEVTVDLKSGFATGAPWDHLDADSLVLLRLLVRNRNHVVSYTDLLRAIDMEDTGRNQSRLQGRMYKLRRELGHTKLLMTVRGRGYRLME